VRPGPADGHLTLGVLESTRPVVEAARYVRLDHAAIKRLTDRLAATPFQRPEWRVEPHWWDDDSERTAQYVFVLDSLNFCFWGEPKWRLEYDGRSWDGYWALAACLRRALQAGAPLLDADFLAEVDASKARELLKGDGYLLLIEERAESLRQLGRALLDSYQGQAANLVAAAGGSAVDLVRRVVEELPSFNDLSRYDGGPVRFYKRAQILCSDLHGAYAGQGLGAFHDLDQLTAFADYKLPQVLREVGVLVYERGLAERIDAKLELDAGSPEEVEIRSATIWAIEELRRALSSRGLQLKAFEIDWYLWGLGQQGDWPRPYHRTRTVFY
jgi:Potential Queuosine, Q, salvage protein family